MDDMANRGAYPHRPSREGYRERYKRIFSYAYIVLLASELTMKMCLYMTYTNVVLYVLAGGGTAMLVGIVRASQLVTSLLFRPLAGRMSDRSRLIPMLFGTAGYFIVSALWLADVPISFAPVVAALQGICFSFASTGVYSLAADVVPSEHVTHCYTYLNLVETAAAAISTTFAIYLRNRSGFHEVFLVVWGLSFVTMSCIVLLSLTSWKRNGGRYYHPGHLFRDYKKALRAERRGAKDKLTLGDLIDKKALCPAVFYMAIMFAGEAVLGYLVAYGKASHIGNPGVFYTVQAVTVYIASLFVGSIDEKHGAKAVLIPGFIFYFLAMAGIFLNISYASIIICGLLFGLGVAFVQPELSSIAVRMAGEDHKGRANSTVGIMIDIGGAAAGLTFGAMADSVGYRSIYAASAGFIIIIALAYLAARKKKLML